MNYLTEAKELIFDLFFEDWMDNNDWIQFQDEFLETTNLTYEKISEDIEIGVNNGYSVEQQKELIEKALKYLYQEK